MKTLFFPTKSENPYISIILRSMTENSIEISDISEIRYKIKYDKRYIIINLNWFENIDTQSNLKTILLFVRQWMRIEYYKMCHIRIVFTFHNIVSHDSKHKFLNRTLIRKLCKYSSAIVTLSTVSKEYLNEYTSDKNINNKVYFVGHPSYSKYYGLQNALPYEATSKLRLLFCGNVRPYKNLELLIDAAKCFRDKQIEFHIVGKPISLEYQNELIKRIDKSKNILCDFRYISDQEIIDLYKSCDATIVPLDIKSSLNSGSILLSFSLGRTTIAPYIGTLHDFDNADFYSYEYTDDESHLNNLISSIYLVYQKWKDNPYILEKQGQSLFYQINHRYSEKIIGRKYYELYSKLINSDSGE